MTAYSTSASLGRSPKATGPLSGNGAITLFPYFGIRKQLPLQFMRHQPYIRSAHKYLRGGSDASTGIVR